MNKPTRDMVALSLTSRERTLILDETYIDEDVIRRLRLASIESGQRVYRMTVEEMEDLLDHLAFAANQSEDPKRQGELDRVYDRLKSVLDAHTGGDFHSGNIPEALLELAEILVDGAPADSPLSGQLDPTGRILGDESEWRTMNREISEPLEELGGLSPMQFTRLVTDDWEGPDVVRLNPDISLEELGGAVLFRQTRILLDAIEEADGVKATVKGYLPRVFVRRMVESMDLPAWMREGPDGREAVLNEGDVHPVHIARVVAELAGLIRKVKGQFKITKKNRWLHGDDAAGRLFSLLFKTFFRRFNLAYLDRLSDSPMVQEMAAYYLFRLSRFGENWMLLRSVMDEIMLPWALPEDEGPYRHLKEDALLHHRLIAPLESFGLLEKRNIPGNGRTDWFNLLEIRKTPLFDRFITFSLE